MAGTDQRLLELLGLSFQAHPWHGVPARAADPELLNAFVEIVPTDAVKYEIDKPTGHLKIDRPQRFSSMCPTLYGFIPRTFCGPRVGARCAERTGGRDIEGDGDPMDVCVLAEASMAHGGFLVRARPIGGLRMVDGNQADDKIVAVLESDLAYGLFRGIGECPEALLERLQHYFLSYKQRPDEPTRTVRIAEVYDREEALRTIERSMLDYEERFGAPGTRMQELQRLLRSS
ncbi:MAG: inorganic pyrophosphatase [Deltaproteobacteria bacterium]|nr:inorganic pyrophosphatase [Deltaproteobacteria bacterium]